MQRRPPRHRVDLLRSPGNSSGFVAWTSVVHGSGVETQHPLPRLGSGDADIARTSKRQHAVEDVGCNIDFRRPTFVLTRAQSLADHLFSAPDCRFYLGARGIAEAFCQPACPFSAMQCRCWSRCVGAVSAVTLTTAVMRGGTITRASR